MAKQPGGGGKRDLKVRVKTARGRKISSQRWLQRQLNDPYVTEARRQGFRSRAAFKLIELDDKYKFLKPGACVVDLGAAPGGWTQIAVARTKSLPAGDDEAGVEDANRVGTKPIDTQAMSDSAPPKARPRKSKIGHVVALDIAQMEPVPGAHVIHLDFMADTAPQELKAVLRGGVADVVLSDMAAPTTGHKRTDHLRIMALAEAAAYFSAEVLRPGGAFLCKVFQGGAERALLDLLKRDFSTVRHVKPPASRDDSAELYVLATGFRGQSRASDVSRASE